MNQHYCFASTGYEPSSTKKNTASTELSQIMAVVEAVEVVEANASGEWGGVAGLNQFPFRTV